MESTENINSCSSSTMSQSEGAIYYSNYKYDYSNENDLKRLEQQIKKNIYIKDEILSIDDAVIYEEIRKKDMVINQKLYPSLFKWYKNMERLKRNWRLSKKLDKGSSFEEYIKKVEEKSRNEKRFNESSQELISGLQVNNNKDNKCDYNKSITKTFKKMNEYKLELGISFKKDKEKNWAEISANLSIICQVYFPRDTEIKPIRDEDNNIYSVIVTRVHKKDYDLSYFIKDVKKNINAVEDINVIDIQEIKKNLDINEHDNQFMSITKFGQFK